MPKRIAKASEQFRDGFNTGRAAAFISIQLKELRKHHKKTIEEVSASTGVPVDVITGLENGELYVFLRAEVKQFMKIAECYDVALSVVYEPVLGPIAEHFNPRPPTWQEEFSKVEVK